MCSTSCWWLSRAIQFRPADQADRTVTSDARVVRVELGDRLVTELTEARLLELHKLDMALSSLLPAD